MYMTKNEHICATAIYYYSASNVTESRLSFRQQCSTRGEYRIEYDRGDHHWLSDVFGCENHEPAVQEIGDIVTKAGRLIAFPNILQHRVKPFKLADPSLPGHRKILALFLVDPNMKIISTANVPCQRRDWWARDIRAAETAFTNLPNELWDMIVDKVDEFPMCMDEANNLRLQLMEERTGYQRRQQRQFTQTLFNLCEH